MRFFNSRPTRRRRRRRYDFPRGTFGRPGLRLSDLRDLPGMPANLPVAAAGVGLYIFFIIFGVTVVGDTAGRSAVMAGIIVAIAACGYVVTRQPTPKDKERR